MSALHAELKHHLEQSILVPRRKEHAQLIRVLLTDGFVIPENGVGVPRVRASGDFDRNLGVCCCRRFRRESASCRSRSP